VAGEYRVRFEGDLNNLSQFTQSIRGAFSQIRSSYQNSATAPVRSIGSPNLNTGRVTTQIDAYNRTLTQSGQVFHRYVTGYVADIARLNTASRSLGTGGTAFGPKNTSFGTSINSRGKAGVYGKDFKPNYGEFFTGQYNVTTGDLDKIEAAQRALIPAQKAFANLQKQAAISDERFNAKRLTAYTRLNELSERQNALMQKRNALTTGGFGNIYTSPTGRQSTRLLPQYNELNKVLSYYKNVLGNANASPQSVAADFAANNNARPVRSVQSALRAIRGVDTLDQDIKSVARDFKKIEAL
jgi:hypothetical protein